MGSRQRRAAEGTDGMYLIGDASRLSGVSQRTLRLYGEMGLLEPDLVKANGYRYYSRDTMLKIPVINYLKAMGFSLEEVQKVLCSGDLLNIKQKFRELLEECDVEERRVFERRETITDWDHLIDEANFVLRAKPTEVCLKYLPGQRLLAMPYEFWGNYADTTINLDFTAFVERCDNVISGPVMTRHPNYEDCLPGRSKNREVLVIQKALRPIPDECAHELPSCMCLATYHVGEPSELAGAYQRVVDYAHEHGHVLAGCAYERYVTDYWTTYDSDLFVTELLLPVTR